MRVVLDTNVFVSGVFFAGPPSRILRAWRDREIRVVVSPPILDEYARVGEKLGRQFPGIDLGPLLQLLLVAAEIVSPIRLGGQVCNDPDDDKFLACAIGGRAKTIVSGDKHLLRVSGYRGLNIVTSRLFVAERLGHGAS